MNIDRNKLTRQIRERYRDAKERGKDVDDALLEATSIPGMNLSNLRMHIANNLTAGLPLTRAISQAMESALGKNPADMPTPRQQMQSKLAARYAAELALHGDPQRAARTAVSGIHGQYQGIAHHLMAATEEGYDPEDAAAQAVSRYFEGGATPFGHAFLGQSDYREPREPRGSRRRWEDLNPPEKGIVASYLVTAGRAGEKPTSTDIDEAFRAIRNER